MVSTASVVIAHGALAMIGTVALFAVLSRAFIDVELTAFWTTVLAATATGLSGWLSYLSASRMIAGGLLVTTFTLYVSHDLAALGEGPRGIRVVGTALAIMGVMLACVGIFPVTVNMLLLLVGGPWIVRRMPRAYFLASWAFLAGLVIWIALSATGYFGLMVVADQPDPRS